jgi:AcrR family transcriptional regulator
VALGLRERKKEQTRRAISEAAHRLFARRGFDAVTVTDVARAADVSEGTVFNYFPTKEDLFYGQMETFEAELVAAVRDRGPGQSALAAFRDFVLERGRGLSAPERADVIEQAARLIDASPALQARERELVAQSTNELAAVLAEEVGAAAGDVEPKAVATALMGVQRALVEHVRASVLAGKRGRALAASLRRQAERAFARLEHGLGDYGVK